KPTRHKTSAIHHGANGFDSVNQIPNSGLLVVPNQVRRGQHDSLEGVQGQVHFLLTGPRRLLNGGVPRFPHGWAVISPCVDLLKIEYKVVRSPKGGSGFEIPSTAEPPVANPECRRIDSAICHYSVARCQAVGGANAGCESVVHA